jgi:hypothetical protein
MAEDWSDKEVELIVKDYFNMLSKELSGKSFNKTEHRKKLIPLLNNRTDGSIEFKHQNISGVLRNLGLPYIKGYKPLSNYQMLLAEKVALHISIIKDTLEPKFISFADSIGKPQPVLDFSSIIQAPPESNIISESEIKSLRKPIKINYLEREQNNILLGEKGEALVIEYEKWNLIRLGKENLANKIEWVSKNDDGAGFDILSKDPNGNDKYIEVKTTKLTKDSPIFFTKNEYEFSLTKNHSYNLYRVFNFNENPKIFCLSGTFDSFCRKEAVQYKGIF